MRLDKNTDSYLYSLYAEHLRFKRLTLREKINYVDDFGDIEIGYDNQEPIKELSIFGHDVSDDRPLYEQAMYEVFNNLHKGFNVDYVSSTFAEDVIENPDCIAEKVGNMSLFDIYGECAGYLLYGDCCLTYSITKTTALTLFNMRNATTIKNQSIGIYTTSATFYELLHFFRERADVALVLGMIVLAAKKHGEVETISIGAGVRRVVPNKDDSVVVNKMPFKVNMLDGSWLKTIIRTEGFSVKGFYRLQPCGVGRRERKLIYIKPFKKHGYVRTARKIVHERKAINS